MENTEGVEPQAEEAGTTEQFVPIHEASDEDLAYNRAGFEKYGEAFFEQNLGAEEGQPEEAATAEQAQGTAQQGAAAQSQQTDAAAQADPIKAQFEKIQKQLDGQELLLKRRTSENAVLRQQIKELNNRLSQGLDEKFAEDPKSAVKDMEAIKENEQLLQQIDSQELAMANAHSVQRLVASHIKPGEVGLEDVTACLKADGLDDASIEAFKRSPETMGSPTEILYLFQRARAEKLLRAVVGAYQSLEAKIKTSEISGADKALANVQRALKRTPTITAGSGAGSQPDPFANLGPKDIASLSDAELKELRKTLSSR